MRFRSVLLAGIVVLAAGCAWPMAGQSPDRSAWARDDTSVTPANAGDLAAGWVGPVTSATAEVVGDRELLVARHGTDLTGLDPATGAVRWSRYLPGSGTPGVRSDFVYAPASDERCSIVQIDRSTGLTVGRLDLGVPPPGPFWTSECTAGDVVVDGDTVIVPWRAKLGVTANCGTNVTVASGLTAYSPDLTQRWFDSSSVTVCNVPPIPPHNLPHVTKVGDHRYVAASAGETGKVYDPSGCSDFSVCRPVASALATSGTWVPEGGSWTSRNGDRLVNVDGATQAVRWRSTDPAANAARTVTADPALDGDRAFAPSGTAASATLAVYDVAGCGSASCAPHWTVALPAVASVRPSIAGDVVLVATGDGHLVLASRTGCGSSSCPVLRTLDLAGTPTASPTVVNGRILVPTTNGIESFALPS